MSSYHIDDWTAIISVQILIGIGAIIRVACLLRKNEDAP